MMKDILEFNKVYCVDDLTEIYSDAVFMSTFGVFEEGYMGNITVDYVREMIYHYDSNGEIIRKQKVRLVPVEEEFDEVKET